MQNLCVDFATLGDLKLVERPATYTIGPHNFQSVKATIKVGKMINAALYFAEYYAGLVN